MSFTAAASGFIVFLLSVPVVQGQGGWGVTCSPTEICALIGSPVEIGSTFTYPDKVNGLATTVESTVWLNEDVDLTRDSEYAGRVQHHCEDMKKCLLKITIIFKLIHVNPCPPDAPKSPSVSVSPSGEIVEGSSVTLTCSSDANPPVDKYTWYKKTGDSDLELLSGQRLDFGSIQSSNSGEYYCTAESLLQTKSSNSIHLNVKYGPRIPSVSVSPSAEIVEGSSVTLSCSSDANPAATYTWYKKNEDSPKASGQTYTITDLRSEDSGEYYCEARNGRGARNSTVHLLPLAGKVTIIVNAVRLTLVILSPIALFLFCLWMRLIQSRKKKKSLNITELNGPVQTGQSDSGPEYENVVAAQGEAPEVQEDLV